MKRNKRTWTALLISLALAAGLATTSATANTPEPTPTLGPSVDRIFLPGLHSWKPISRQSLILWTSPSKPYLVSLRGPVIGLHFAEFVGIQATGTTLHARFDSVVVDGFKYPIASITPLTKHQAKAL